MKILIVYGTTEGQTRKIATFLKDEAEKVGHEVTLCDTTNEPPAPVGYDVVLIGSSVHMHKYQSAVFHYVKSHAAELNKINSAFFSVSLTAAHADAQAWKELGEVTTGFLHDTGWNPTDVEQVAGALKYTQYDFFKKLVMRMIAKKEGRSTDTSGDYEYTDWTEVKAFLNRMMKV